MGRFRQDMLSCRKSTSRFRSPIAGTAAGRPVGLYMDYVSVPGGRLYDPTRPPTMLLHWLRRCLQASQKQISLARRIRFLVFRLSGRALSIHATLGVCSEVMPFA